MKRTETPAQRIDRLMNTGLHLLSLSEVAELNAHTWIATRPTFRVQTDARTGRRYQLKAVLAANGSFMQATTGRRYNVVKTWIDLTIGDAVRHGDTGEIGVIVNESYSRTQVEVSLENHTTQVWYVSRITTV